MHYYGGFLLYFVVLMFAPSFAVAALQDPTRPAMVIKSSSNLVTQPFVLSAIIVSKDKRIAVINGQIMKEGDIILGQQIAFIDAHSVQLIGPSGKIILFLFGTPIKRPSFDAG